MFEQRVIFALAIVLGFACCVIAGCGSSRESAPPAEVVAPPPPSTDTALSTGKYVRGSASAAVTIVEFADYQCPYCAVEEPILERLLSEYGSRLRLIYHDYPIHPHSEVFAQAARCAGEQDGFWKMHDLMFRRTDHLDVNQIAQYASTVGLDGDAVEACVKSGRYKQSVDADLLMGKVEGVRGTPSFFVNGKLLEGGQSYDDLKNAINAAMPPPAPSGQ